MVVSDFRVVLVALFFFPTVVWGELGEALSRLKEFDASASAIQAIRDVDDQRTKLISLVEELRAKELSVGWGEFQSSKKADILRYSDGLMDYRSQRSEVFTRLAMELWENQETKFRNTVESNDKAKVVHEKFQQFLRIRGEVPRMASFYEQAKVPDKNVRKKLPGQYSNLLTAHMEVLWAMQDHLDSLPKAKKPMSRYFGKLLKRLMEGTMNRIVKTYSERQVVRGRNPYQIIDWVLRLYYRLMGKRVNTSLENLSGSGRKAINFIMGPHGTDFEVVLQYATFSRALAKKGQQAAVVVSPFEGLIEGLYSEKMVRAMIDNPHFIVVFNVAERTREMKESGRFEVPGFHEQIVRAHQHGINNIILFGEGRGPRLGGGITNVNPQSVLLLATLPRRLKSLGLDVELTVTSMNLPNVEIGIGSEEQPKVVIDVVRQFKGDEFQQLVRNKELGAAALNYLWDSRIHELHSDRVAGIPSEATTLTGILKMYQAACRYRELAL